MQAAERLRRAARTPEQKKQRGARRKARDAGQTPEQKARKAERARTPERKAQQAAYGRVAGGNLTRRLPQIRT